MSRRVKWRNESDRMAQDATVDVRRSPSRIARDSNLIRISSQGSQYPPLRLRLPPRRPPCTQGCAHIDVQVNPDGTHADDYPNSELTLTARGLKGGNERSHLFGSPLIHADVRSFFLDKRTER